MHLNGHDLRDMVLEDRREILAGLIGSDSRIQFSETMPGEANGIYHLIDAAGLEGMVSKRRDSKYRSGPTTNWLKTKSFTESEFELLGVERERGKPAFALMADPGTRKYVGSAFVSVNREMRERLWKRVQEHAGPPPKDMPKRPATQWVKPGIKARVKHLRGEEDLRHASLQDFWTTIEDDDVCLPLFMAHTPLHPAPRIPTAAERLRSGGSPGCSTRSAILECYPARGCRR
ncbi:hypothetical protein [Mesorhizobium sp.]|uniref:ATP-dependent DNA ligase n=1 Tax=Mesorhizobium sp. TaxID=1871066 RepID=UPI00257B5BA8|nr:hypothetical protein [Mesorhizobium sp.]